MVGVMIMAFATMAMPVMAAETGSTVVSGNIPGSMSLTVTGATVDLGDITTTGAHTDTTSVTLAVQTNYATWAVTAADALDLGSSDPKDSSYAGKMTESASANQFVASSPKTLTNALQISSAGKVEESPKPAVTGSSLQSLSGTGSPITVISGTAYNTEAVSGIPLIFSQTTDAGDKPLPTSEAYRITVTFTGSTT